MGVTEHRRIQKEYGKFYEDDVDADDDYFDAKDAAVICRNCIQDVEIEIENQRR